MLIRNLSVQSQIALDVVFCGRKRSFEAAKLKKFQKKVSLIICTINPISPIRRIPIPLTLTIVLYSVPVGFFVILNTLMHSAMKVFALYFHEVWFCSSIFNPRTQCPGAVLFLFSFCRCFSLSFRKSAMT